MTPKALLKAAHAAGHRGPVMLRRFVMAKNADRRLPHDRITTDVLEAAIALDQETADRLAGVER